MDKYKLVYPLLVKGVKKITSKKVSLPSGSKKAFIWKVRTGEFTEIMYTPKNAKVLRVIGKRKILDTEIKTISLPKANMSFFGNSVKLKKL